MSLDFKNNIKNLLAICRRNLSRALSWTVFPRIYTNLHSKGCFQFCCQVRRSVISTILESYMSFCKKWEIITKIFDSWKIQNVSIFYFWNNNTKNGSIFQIFTLYSKGHHFSITKLDILIFCNILHLEWIFESWVEKGWFLHKLFVKSLVKNTHEMSKKWNSIFTGPQFESSLPVKLSFPLE